MRFKLEDCTTYLLDSLSITSYVLFLQTSILVRDWRSSASHLPVSVGSSCRGRKCMLFFPFDNLDLKTKYARNRWGENCLTIPVRWYHWNMSSGFELLWKTRQKTWKLPLQQQVERFHSLLLPAAPTTTPSYEIILTHRPFPTDLERSLDLPCDCTLRWESLRQRPKRWFLKNLAGACYRSFTRPTELKASLFPLLECVTLPSPPSPPPFHSRCFLM